MSVSQAVKKSITITGHLFDSMTLSKVLDIINTLGGNFKMQGINIGEAKDSFSDVSLDVFAPSDETLQKIITALEPYMAKVPLAEHPTKTLPVIEHKTVAKKYPLGKDDAHPSILMSPPDYFTVDYAINPWMEGVGDVDLELAKQQWKNLYDAIEAAGAKMYTLDPVKGLPDLVFTANFAFVYGDQAVTAHYKHPERQGEEPYGQKWLTDHGYEVTTLPETVYFEGSGDALIWKDRVFSGYKMRSSLAAHSFLSAASGLPVMSLELSDPKFYHVDVCLCPLTNDYLIWYPDAFDEYGQAVIKANVPEEKRIVVSAEEANKFACNAVSVGDTVIFNKGSDELAAKLTAKGFKPVMVDMSEFLKAGGSCKCLTVRLDH